jgi:hypothetical protein
MDDTEILEAQEDERERELGGVLEAIDAAAGDDDERGQWYADVYRVIGSQRDGFSQPFIVRVAVDELETLPTLLQRDHCEGFPGVQKFRVQVRRNKKLFRTFTLVVEGRAPRAAAESTRAPAPALDAAAILEAMRRENAEFQRSILTALSQRPAAAADTVRPADFVKDMAATIAAVKEIMPQPSATTADTFRAALDFVRELGADKGGGTTGILDLVQTAIATPGVQDVLGAIAQGIRTAPPQAPGRPAPAPHDTQPTAPMGSPLARALPQIPPELEQVAQVLIGKAQAGEAPQAWASYALDGLPGWLIDAIDRLPESVSEIDYLAQLHPGIAQYRNWFAGLLEAMYDENERRQMGAANNGHAADFGAAGMADSDTGRAGGNAGSPEAHAGLNPARQN